jgi:outer membrane protein TolC
MQTSGTGWYRGLGACAVLGLLLVLQAPAFAANEAVEIEPAEAAENSDGQDTGDAVVLVKAGDDTEPLEPSELAGTEDALTATALTVETLVMPTELSELIAFLSEDYQQYHEDLSIEEALVIALKHNHDLNSKRLTAAAATKDIDIRWTDLNPQLSMQGSIGYQWTNASSEPMEIPIPGSDPVEIPTSDGSGNDLQRSLAFSLTQRIYDFGLTNDLIDVAEAQHAIQKYTVDMAEQQLVHDVIAAYYRFNLALGQARVRDNEVKLANELLRQTKIQFDVGVVPRLDVIRAESRVEQAKSAYIQAQAQVGDAAAYFYSLLGVEDERYIPELVTAPLAEVGPPPVELNAAVGHALEFRPELELQYATLFAGEVSRRLTKNRPIVEGYANAQYQKPPQFGGTDNYSVGIQLMWELFDGNKSRHEREKSKLELASITEGILHLEGQLELDVTTAWNNVVASRAETESAAATLELSNEAYRAASIGYAAGVTPYIDYLDALDQNIAAAIGYLVSLANVKLAQVRLAKALGFPMGYPGDNRLEGDGTADIYATLGFGLVAQPPTAAAAGAAEEDSN